MPCTIPPCLLSLAILFVNPQMGTSHGSVWAKSMGRAVIVIAIRPYLLRRQLQRLGNGELDVRVGPMSDVIDSGPMDTDPARNVAERQAADLQHGFDHSPTVRGIFYVR